MAASGPAAPNHPPVLRTAATALFLLTTLNLFNFIDRYVLPGVQPLIQREFHIDDAQTGLLTLSKGSEMPKLNGATEKE